MQNFRSLRKLFGFTRSGTSIVGRHARNVLGKRELRRGLGMALIALTTATIIVHNFGSIGGNVALANTPVKPVIDATTATTIQTPVVYVAETRGVSWFHAGADLAAPTGTPVKPIMAGTVKEVNHYFWGYGLHVILSHDLGYESIYGHLSKINVEAGQKVNLETVIGEVGSTGLSTGPHLHLEIHQNGNLINPADIVPGVK